MTPAQCRAARALLDWSPQQLADAADMAVVTVEHYEDGVSHPTNATIDAIRQALVRTGVAFVADGVQLRSAGAVAPDREAASHGLREVGPESEVRGGHEAPAETVP